MYDDCCGAPRYALAKHVHLCVRDEDVVFLDLRHDKYFALEAAGTAPLAQHVKGWPVRAARADGMSGGFDEDRSLLNELLRRGILTQDATSGKAALPTDIATATHEWTLDDDEGHTRARVTELTALLAAALTAAALLRYSPIEKVVERVRSRKAAASGTRSRKTNEHAIRRLVGIFGRNSSMFVSTKGKCLYECLALLEFLARYRIYPTWVFGVQTRPFSAHCWIQHSHAVLNDTIDRTGLYTPIMTI
jgi:hypothetical protein